jgi:hypothetical protein
MTGCRTWIVCPTLSSQDMVYIDVISFCRSMLCSQAHISFGTLATACTLASVADCFHNSSSTVDILQLQWVNRPQKMWHGEGMTTSAHSYFTIDTWKGVFVYLYIL